MTPALPAARRRRQRRAHARSNPGAAGERRGGRTDGGHGSDGAGGVSGKLITEKKALTPSPGLATVPRGWLEGGAGEDGGDQRLAGRERGCVWGGSRQPPLPATTKSQTQQKQHMARAARGCKLNIKGRLDN